MTEQRTEHVRLSRAQQRVLSFADNNVSLLHGTSGSRNASIARMRTIRSLQDRGLLDGYDLTEAGFAVVGYYRDRSLSA